jgi:hypothetical protein
MTIVSFSVQNLDIVLSTAQPATSTVCSALDLPVNSLARRTEGLLGHVETCAAAQTLCRVVQAGIKGESTGTASPARPSEPDAQPSVFAGPLLAFPAPSPLAEESDPFTAAPGGDPPAARAETEKLSSADTGSGMARSSALAVLATDEPPASPASSAADTLVAGPPPAAPAHEVSAPGADGASVSGGEQFDSSPEGGSALDAVRTAGISIPPQPADSRFPADGQAVTPETDTAPVSPGAADHVAAVSSGGLGLPADDGALGASQVTKCSCVLPNHMLPTTWWPFPRCGSAISFKLCSSVANRCFSENDRHPSQHFTFYLWEWTSFAPDPNSSR